jgi:hypothetical protein
VSGFSIAGSIPNVSLVKDASDNDIVLLLYSISGGICEATSTDGVTFSGTGVIAANDVNSMLDSKLLFETGVLVRQLSSGTWRYFIKGLGAPGSSQHIYIADRPPGGSITLGNSGDAVYTGGVTDMGFVGVIDIVKASGGEWVMYYVSTKASPSNSRNAISANEGMSWTFNSDNPFSDISLTGATNLNVDPAVLQLQDDTFMAVTMRAMKLYFWNSLDGYTWTEIAQSELCIDLWASAERGDAQGLFDPTLLQLPNGTIYLYVTAGQGTTDHLVAATITY